jgi:hypothetical protein
MEIDDYIPMGDEPKQQNLPFSDMEDDRLCYIREQGRLLAKIKEEIEQHDRHLSELKAEYKHISEVKLPPIMDELGIQMIQLSDGSVIQRSSFVDAKITNPEVALAWLRANNHGAVIKSKIDLALANDQQRRAAEQALRSVGISPTFKDDVHHMTLKSLVKELIEQGSNFPKDAFGVYQGERVVFK